jgi:hypothetical protein
MSTPPLRMNTKVIAIRIVKVCIALTALWFLLIGLLMLTLCRDYGFVCKYTGSRKGHREWFYGTKTKQWYSASALETFIATNYPTELRHNWVSYQGDGRNVFGWVSDRSHGRPGPITYLPFTMFARIPDADKKPLYDLLQTGDEDAIRKRLDEIAKRIFSEATDRK